MLRRGGGEKRRREACWFCMAGVCIEITRWAFFFLLVEEG